MRGRVCLLVVLFLAGLPARTEAGWPSGPFNSVPIAVAPRVQSLPSGVPDGQGGAFFVWTDGRDSLVTGTDIYAQHVNALGQTTWQGNGVPVSTRAGIQGLGGVHRSALVTDGSGGLIVAFSSDGDNFLPLPARSYVQRLDANGVPQWGDSGLALTSRDVQTLGSVLVSDGAGGAFAAWQEFDLVTHERAVRVQHLDANGNPLWVADGVAVCDSCSTPNMTRNASGGIVLCWLDFRSDANGDLYAQRLDAAGVAQWTPEGNPITAYAGGVSSPRIVADPGGGVLIAWTDVDQFPAQARVQKVSFQGFALWAPGGVPMTDPQPGDKGSTYVVSDGLGGAFVTFNNELPGQSFDAWAQRILATGGRAWGNGVLLASGTDIQSPVGIVGDGAGGMIVDWIDQQTGFYDLHAQRLNLQGVKQWGAAGSAVTLAPGAQHLATIVPNGNGGAFIAWTDKSVDAGDLRVQYVQSNGTVGGEVLGVPPATPAPAGRVAFARNPARGEVRIRLHRERAEPGSLELFDVTGRSVASRSIEGLAAGTHEVAIAPAGLVPAGLYFVRLRSGDRIETARGVVSP